MEANDHVINADNKLQDHDINENIHTEENIDNIANKVSTQASNNGVLDIELNADDVQSNASVSDHENLGDEDANENKQNTSFQTHITVKQSREASLDL
ncbi:hypothetical protein HK096_008437 [Nowakowskiella sp. JEL0078]|nr:hypothetical protein HK096_008437 [Nowakowskiella sp. JEL0078]